MLYLVTEIFAEDFIISQAQQLSEGGIAQSLRMEIKYFKVKSFPDRYLDYQKDDFLDCLKSGPHNFSLF